MLFLNWQDVHHYNSMVIGLKRMVLSLDPVSTCLLLEKLETLPHFSTDCEPESILFSPGFARSPWLTFSVVLDSIVLLCTFQCSNITNAINFPFPSKSKTFPQRYSSSPFSNSLVPFTTLPWSCIVSVCCIYIWSVSSLGSIFSLLSCFPYSENGSFDDDCSILLNHFFSSYKYMY